MVHEAKGEVVSVPHSVIEHVGCDRTTVSSKGPHSIVADAIGTGEGYEEQNQIKYLRERMSNSPTYNGKFISVSSNGGSATLADAEELIGLPI